ncbi:MAG: metallophosphoesterase [Syntrophomonadaceae bacterium]|nr:metallophosphoesterase [Syntrophomonadaceae bacterium]MDD3889831.1 metallophosphoesterase [Syntrophomonadaceae bacterium]MDD4550464.1 metallophosphoesterase [Syntrophomonadaceae bacterium]
MRRKRHLVIIGLLTGLVFVALYNGLVIKKYTINTSKLDAAESVRIVLITDLHNHVYGKNQTKLVSLIKEQNPDIIALAGDIADDHVPIAGTELLLDGIKGLAPIYYVSGNHEFWSNDINRIKNTIRKYGVTILENSYEQISINNSSIIIGGVDDPDITKYEKPDLDWEGEFYNAFSELENRSEFKILLAHRAELVEIYKKTYFDLVLSGHAHGGQVRIPFLLNGLYAPNQGWFPKYAGGIYKHESLTHIVSRGVSYNPRLPRIFNPPEVVIIEVKGEETSPITSPIVNLFSG